MRCDASELKMVSLEFEGIFLKGNLTLNWFPFGKVWKEMR